MDVFLRFCVLAGRARNPSPETIDTLIEDRLRQVRREWAHEEGRQPIPTGSAHPRDEIGRTLGIVDYRR